MRRALLLCLTAALGFAYVPQSFRYQSTAGVLWDDYDLLHDPALMLDIQGSRIYTNLSNCVTGNEAQFGSNRSNFFLVGGSTKFGTSLAAAGIFDHLSYRQPLFTGLFSPDSLDSLFGSARSTYAEWRDPDSNGTYDYKRVMETERNAWRSGSGTDFFLGAGMPLAGGKARLGAAFVWDDGCVEGTDPDSDYVLHCFDSSLVTGRLTWLSDDTARYGRRAFAGTKRLVLCGWYDLAEGLSAELALGPALTSRDNSHDWTDASFTDYNPGGAAPTDFERLSVTDSDRMPYSGLSLPVTARLVARSAEVETWWRLGGLLESEKLGVSPGASHVARFERTLNPGDSSVLDSVLHDYRGATANTGVNAGVRRLHHLADRLDLGFAFDLGLRFSADSLFDTSGQVQVVTYDNGDSLQTIDDYVQTVTTAESWLRRETGFHASVTLPIGLEFRVISPVALRLGAQPTLSWDDVTTTSQLMSWQPRKTRTDYGDGSFTERIDEVQRNPSGSETRKSFTQTTEFTYGAGFRPVENLQIDLMGFANLTNLFGWRLSATLRF